MIKHWGKGHFALSDDNDICIEWNNGASEIWFDIERDGSFTALRKYPDGRREERHWVDPSAAFAYARMQLTDIFGDSNEHENPNNR